MKRLNISGLELYSITEDGKLFSHRKNKFIKPAFNSYGYLMAYLTPTDGSRARWHMLHRLVAITYISDPPFERAEIDHIDNNRMNNNVSNLQWISHAENIQQSYKRGRDRTKCGRPAGYKVEDAEIIRKMSEAKCKAVSVSNGVEVKTYDSIDNMIRLNTLPFKMYRKLFNKIVNNGGYYKGYTFAFV